jgi:hypothetical protein
MTEEEVQDLEDDAPDKESTEAGEHCTLSSAALIIQELKAEIQSVEELEKLAYKVRNSGQIENGNSYRNSYTTKN